MSAPTNVVFPSPRLNAGERLAVSGYTRGQVADYGNARADERDEIHAALAQPPEAPAAVEVSRLAEAGERVLEEWNRLFPATVYVSSQQTAWEDFEFRQMSELRAALKQGKQS